ncbi:MAG TPA: hypothetical protein EYH42_07965, partial [Sulfurovum sp.]|nr:hypothetical protein [Sulfurovum sp.]
MKLLPAPTYKNRSQFSNNQDKAYNISVAKYSSLVITKKEKTTFIIQLNQNQNGLKWTKKNLKQMLKEPQNWESVMSGYLMNIGFLDSKEYPKLLTNMNVKNDFIFLDYDNKVKGQYLTKSDPRYLSFEEASLRLKQSGYNFILNTSTSHKSDDSQIDKLHILIPVYKTITSKDEYQLYREKVHNFLFPQVVLDDGAKSNVNNKNGANITTVRCEVEFSKSDFDLKIDVNTKTALKQTSKIKTRASVPSHIKNKDIEDYGHQVNQMFGYNLSSLSTPQCVKFHRNANDLGAGVFNVPYPAVDTNYDPYLFFDNNTKGNGTRKEFSTMFALDDYVQRQQAQGLRNDVQQRIGTLGEEFLYGEIHRHMYIIANEGAGKSYSLLKLGSLYNFIYVCHTKKKITETAQTLKQLSIEYKIIVGVEDILTDNGHKHLIGKYKQYAKKTTKPSFR